MRRKSDRVEAFIFGGLLVTAMGAAPLAAMGASHWAYEGAVHAARVQQATDHRVEAMLVATPSDTSSSGYSVTSTAPATASWTTPSGAVRTGQIVVPAGSVKGDQFSIWIDAAGNATSPPLTQAEAAGQGTFAAVMGIIITFVTCLTVALITRLVMNRRRLAAWELDWAITAPKWNRQHW